MNTLYLNFVITICVIISSSLPANETTNLRFTNFSAEDGLSNSFVNCIYQDFKGYMWFGTGNGLNRFDGIDIVTYNHNPVDSQSLSGNMINVIYEDHNKNLWIGTNLGICVYNRDLDKFKQKHLYEMGFIPVNDIYQDKSGDYWFCAAGTGVFHYSEKLEFIENLNYQPDCTNCLSFNFTSKILEDYQGLLWIGGDSGICSFNKITKQIVRFNPGEPANKKISEHTTISLFLDSEKNLWISTMNGLNKFSILSQKIEKYFYQPGTMNSLPSSYVYKVTEDLSGNIWVATKKGLCKYNSKENNFIHIDKNYTSDDFFKTEQITEIFIDKQNILWLGTAVKGVYSAFHETKSFEYNSIISETLQGTSVMATLKDSKGYIWIGTDGKGIYSFSPDNKVIKHFPEIPVTAGTPGGPVVLSIFEDSKKSIWIGTYKNGLYKYNETQKNFIQYLNDPSIPGSLSHNDVRDITEDLQGNLVLATNGGGLNIYNKDGNDFKTIRNNKNDFQNSLINDWCTKVYIDKKGIYWIGTYDGLTRFNPYDNTYINYQHKYPQSEDNLSNNWIYSICIDSDNHVWIGTAEGLNELIPEKKIIKHYFRSDGLPGNTISGIVEDNNGFLWISTNNGLSKLDRVNKSFKNFDKYYGLQGNEFVNGSCYKDSDGIIYFGGLSGINIFNPENISVNTYVPPIVIEDILVNNKTMLIGTKDAPLKKHISETTELILPYNKNTLTLKFASLNYINSNKNQYAVKLEGSDEDWVSIGNQHTYTYTKLSPGRYTFRVKGSNNNDVWNETGVSVKITIRQPYWKTSLAYCFYFLIIVGLLYLYRFFTIIRISTKKDLLLEHFKREKLEELSQLKLRFFTNISHEFRTPLTLILASIEKLLKSNRLQKVDLIIVQKNARRLFNLINQLLDFRKIESGKTELKVRKGNIAEYMNQIASAFETIANKKQIELKITCSEKSIELWFDHDKMEVILYNLISNAFKFTPAQGNINILIKNITENNLPGKAENEYIQISITDTGIGIADEDLPHLFTEFYQLHGADYKHGTGIGLAYTKELVELHKGIIKVTSEPNKGSRFTIIFPSGNVHFTQDQIEHGLSYNFPMHEIQDQIRAEFENEHATATSVIDDEYADVSPSVNAPVILIVEDDDELRTLIGRALFPRFRVIEAVNGKEAIDLAIHESPDLIISDIIMPEMDGIELCSIIKKDLQTSHIPLILLTGIQSYESKLEAIEKGADDYIIKPFNVRELVLKIHNIINTRKKLQDKFKREIILAPKNITATSADEKFMLSVMKLIEDNIKDPNFDLVSSASGIGISRSILYRKMQKLMNQSPNGFVNSIRIKKGATLLKQNKLNVSEVAYEVGFKDPLYFSKCFKKQFDLSPTEYVKINSL